MFRHQTSPDDQKLQGTPNMKFWTFSDSQTEKNCNYWESEKVERSCKIDSNMMRQRWRSKSSELWTNDIGHKILILFWRHLNVEEEEEEVWEHVQPHTPNLGLYQFIFRSKPMLEACLNFQKNLLILVISRVFKRSWISWKNQWISGWIFDLQQFFLKTMIIYQNRVFHSLRTMIMNNTKNRPDNCGGGGVCFLFLSNCLTLVQSPNPVRLWEVDNHKRTVQIMLAARTRGGKG